MDMAVHQLEEKKPISADVLTPQGLSEQEAAQRLKEVGPNLLPEPKSPGLTRIFLSQFTSPFIYILLVAAGVSLLIGQTPSAIFIAAVLVLNAAIGTVQEYSAQRSAAALRAMVKGTAHVVRDGALKTIDVSEVVPGDLIHLSSGDKTPADVSLVSCDDFCVDESMLTGESLAVVKDTQNRSVPEAPLGDRHDMAFAGSTVTRGRGKGIVTATALSTEIGKIAERVTADRIAQPPLMIRIRRFTYQVAGAIFVAILALAALMALRGGYAPTDMVMMGIGLAVSTIPEGLPAALTVALAIGMQRMAKNNVIIRKLVAVEALGSCTFICSDKTGTLTVNELTIHKVLLPSERTYDVTGAGVAPGNIDGADKEALRDLIVTGVRANEAVLDYDSRSWLGDGDIVDVAFLVLAKKYGISLAALLREHQQITAFPYESERAFSGSLDMEAGRRVLHVKGSPEKILAASTHMQGRGGVVPIDRGFIQNQFENLAASGYRIIALAHKYDAAEDEDPLEGLIFLGLVAMIDPIRPEACGAIQRCLSGGIEVAMVTGDHPATARAIGTQLGLCKADSPVVTGAMIKQAAETGKEAMKALVLPGRVFARIEPTQKELIVASFAEAGHFVAVTGDGVNDAPAMRRANTGVAMGRSGTDVAKEAADLIITDDNFASIVSGIEQGRIVYNNIIKVISLLTATGFSALVVFFASVAAGLPMPMTAVQLLWLNLVANGVQDVALAFEPKECNELDQPPRKPSEPIFNAHVIEHILVAGSAMGLMAFGVFWTAYSTLGDHGAAQNITLLMMVLFGNVHALSSRSERISLFKMPYFSNRFLAIATPAALLLHLTAMHIPGLKDVAGLEPVPLSTFAALAAIALVFLGVEELHKWAQRRRKGTL